MMKFPGVLKRAQKQDVDSIVGLQRLSTFADWDMLLYINCCVKECLRLSEMNRQSINGDGTNFTSIGFSEIPNVIKYTVRNKISRVKDNNDRNFDF